MRSLSLSELLATSIFDVLNALFMFFLHFIFVISIKIVKKDELFNAKFRSHLCKFAFVVSWQCNICSHNLNIGGFYLKLLMFPRETKEAYLLQDSYHNISV